MRRIENSTAGRCEYRRVDQRTVTAGIKSAQHSVIWDIYRERRGLICFGFDFMIDEATPHAITAVIREKEFMPGLINGIGKRPKPS